MSEKEDLREPIKRQVGGSLATKSPLARLARLRQNADALTNRSWRGKDDGTHVRKIVGAPDR